jgi:large subunit ribosomal protein L25
VKFLTDDERMVAHITLVKEEVAPTPEAVADAATATPAEPEVIKKGKQDVEGEEGEAKPEGKPEKKEKK